MGCAQAPPPAPAYIPPSHAPSSSPPSVAPPAADPTGRRDSLGEPPQHVQMQIPAGAVPGTLLRFQTPDGRMVQCSVPPGAAEGSMITVEVPRNFDHRHSWKNLLEAFNYCDPEGTGNITDHNLFAELAKKLANVSGDPETVWRSLDQDGNGAVNFPEFVEWAENNNVSLPVGLTGEGDQVTFPATWTGPRSGDISKSWNQRLQIRDAVNLQELQSLFKACYKKTWTRDRKSTGMNQVPAGYELVRAVRNENYSDWRRYYLKRHMLAHSCSSKPFVQHRALTERVPGLVERHKLRAHVNEWFLFHGTSADAAEKICSEDFVISLAGSATGTLYGRGSYFAESVTKADEYAKEGDDGTCCMLVCRVTGGYVMYTDEVTPDPDLLQDKVLKGDYHSILGDREKCRNTYKEFVVFDADQVYVEYLLFYKRLYGPAPG